MKLGGSYEVRYDACLVEEAVLIALRKRSLAEQRAFYAEREGLYLVADPDEREACFQGLHDRFFVALGLSRPLESAILERPLLTTTERCRVARAGRRKEEFGDLTPSGALLLRLRPESFLDLSALLLLLRRELLHVSDMLDPAFGYERDLPLPDASAARLNIVRDRYRVIWDVTVDGRLHREGKGVAAERQKRLSEFGDCFHFLGDRTSDEFERWFGDPNPRHADMCSFAARFDGIGDVTAECPLCHLPSKRIESADSLSINTLAEVRADNRSWEPSQGLCGRCLELYSGSTFCADTEQLTDVT